MDKIEKVKEFQIANAEFVNICNREMQYHIDRAFHYYMINDYQNSDEELIKIFHLIKEARERIKIISQPNL